MYTQIFHYTYDDNLPVSLKEFTIFIKNTEFMSVVTFQQKLLNPHLQTALSD